MPTLYLNSRGVDVRLDDRRVALTRLDYAESGLKPKGDCDLGPIRMS
ncbi:MAG: hypothetical protein GX945_00540 [Lentisphaerae bacterium]|nr:hypothetical protein [Lentisphaerota bacterium]